MILGHCQELYKNYIFCKILRLVTGQKFYHFAVLLVLRKDGGSWSSKWKEMKKRFTTRTEKFLTLFRKNPQRNSHLGHL